MICGLQDRIRSIKWMSFFEMPCSVFVCKNFPVISLKGTHFLIQNCLLTQSTLQVLLCRTITQQAHTFLCYLSLVSFCFSQRGFGVQSNTPSFIWCSNNYGDCSKAATESADAADAKQQKCKCSMTPVKALTVSNFSLFLDNIDMEFVILSWNFPFFMCITNFGNYLPSRTFKF